MFEMPLLGIIGCQTALWAKEAGIDYPVLVFFQHGFGGAIIRGITERGIKCKRIVYESMPNNWIGIVGRFELADVVKERGRLGKISGIVNELSYDPGADLEFLSIASDGVRMVRMAFEQEATVFTGPCPDELN